MIVERRAFLGSVAMALTGMAGCTDSPADAGDLTISSPAFDEGDIIPEEFTCSGDDISPPLSFEETPPEAESLAVIVDDPDAPGRTFTHWLIWNIDTDETTIPAAVDPGETVGVLGGARQGTNDFGTVGYRGPCPPEDDGPHTYRFRGYALESTVALEPGSERGAVEPALENVAVATGRLTGEFER